MMDSIVQDPLLQSTLRASLAALFASAALHKARDFPLFRETLRVYQVMPDVLVPLAAGMTLGAEVVVAVGVLVPSGFPHAVLGAIMLLAIYSAAIAVNLARGRRTIDCGCGGPGARQPISEWLLARNLGLVVAALVLFSPVRDRPWFWLDWFTLACAVAVFALAWDAGHRLLAEWERLRPHLQPVEESE